MSDIRVPNNKTFVNGNVLQVKLNWSQGFQKELNNKYGLGSPLQQFIDSEFMKDIQPYMPFKTGTLIRLMTIHTIIGSGEIRVISPYVLFLYYGKVMVGVESGSPWARKGEKKVTTERDLRFNEEPKRGSFWDVRFWADNSTVFMNKVRAFNNRGG